MHEYTSLAREQDTSCIDGFVSITMLWGECNLCMRRVPRESIDDVGSYRKYPPTELS